MGAFSVRMCRHCRRPIVRGSGGWVHTDLMAGCLCPWRVTWIGTVAEPAGPGRPVQLAPVPRRPSLTPPPAQRPRVCDPDCWCRGKQIAGAA